MRTARILFSVAIATGFTVLGRADGGFFKSEQIEAEPRIPRQRAIVTFQEGRQTLIIESVLEGTSGDYGWLVPLPAVPLKVQEEEPETIRDVFEHYGVRPRRLPPFNLGLVVGSSLVLFVVGASMVWRYRGISNPGHGPMIEATLGLAFLLLLTSDLARNLVSSSYKADMASEGASSHLYDFGSIGSYEVKVIESKEPGAAAAWLTANQFSFTQKDREVLDAYSRDGWCFLAAKIRKSSTEALPPHPLAIEFAAAKPIYPMRLTGVRTDEMRLELMVFGAKRAEVEELDLWRCKPDARLTRLDLSQGVDSRRKSNEGFDTLTYLRANLDASQMDHDFSIQWGERFQFTAEAYSYEQAGLEAVKRGSLAFATASTLLGWFSVWFGWSPKRFHWMCLAISLGVAAAVVAYWYSGIYLVEALS